MCHRNTWWFKWFKSGKFQASISASPPPKLGIYHFDSFCVLVSVSWCFSQTSHANCGVNQIFRPNEDVLVYYGFSHGVLLISLKSGYRFQLFQHRPASACACFACSLAAKVSCKSCHGISQMKHTKKILSAVLKSEENPDLDVSQTVSMSYSHAPCMSCPCSKSFIPFCAQLTPMTQQKWAAHLYAYDFGSFFLGHLVRRLPRLLSDTLEYHEYRVHQNIQK